MSLYHNNDSESKSLRGLNQFVVLKSRVNPAPTVRVVAEVKPPGETSAENNRAEVLKSLRLAVDQRPPFIPFVWPDSGLMLINVSGVISGAELYQN